MKFISKFRDSIPDGSKRVTRRFYCSVYVGKLEKVVIDGRFTDVISIDSIVEEYPHDMYEALTPGELALEGCPEMTRDAFVEKIVAMNYRALLDVPGIHVRDIKRKVEAYLASDKKNYRIGFTHIRHVTPTTLEKWGLK